jgi:hypothetical protein
MMLFLRSLFLLLTWVAGSYGCACHDHPDKMHSLPGLNMPLPSPWYSGYLRYVNSLGLGREIATHVLTDSSLLCAETFLLLYF